MCTTGGVVGQPRRRDVVRDDPPRRLVGDGPVEEPPAAVLLVHQPGPADRRGRLDHTSGVDAEPAQRGDQIGGQAGTAAGHDSYPVAPQPGTERGVDRVAAGLRHGRGTVGPYHVVDGEVADDDDPPGHGPATPSWAVKAGQATGSWPGTSW